jgi:hypothetical protein
MTPGADIVVGAGWNNAVTSSVIEHLKSGVSLVRAAGRGFQ